MLVTFHCTKCQAKLEGDTSMGGSEVKCPQCGQGLKVPQKSFGPGITVGGFEIIRMLGEGGMGEVYLAKQLSLGRNVALKILPAQMKMRRGVAERFFKEVKLLARLDHANIVVAHEAGEDSGVMYLAMGYVDGESVEQKLRREGPMKEAEALQMIGKLAGALDHAWSKHKLLHRDIKPSNVMLTADGELKLMDFGLAKCLQEEQALTLTGTVMGTPNYMSPEQVEGNVELDCRADLYSLGATLYHMMTGKLPFAGSSVMETLRKQINEALPDPRTINPAVSENCVTLIEIMLSKNRDQRHPDYKTLIDDIERVRAGDPPMREPLQAGESVLLRAQDLGISRAPKPAAHRKAPAGSNWKLIIGAAAGAVLVLIVGLVLVLVMRAPKQETAAAKPMEKPAVEAKVEKAAPSEPKKPDITRTVAFKPTPVKIPDTPEEKASCAALIDILKLAGVGTDLTKSRDLMLQIAARGYPETDAAKIKEAVAAFDKTHGETETARSQWRLLDFLKQADPEPRPPLLQATEENVKRAIEDWRIENDGAIGDVKSSIDKYGVTVIISAPSCPAQTVRALGDLPLSSFKSEGAKGQIRDIAPLADCPLTDLSLQECPVEDFSILRKIKTLQSLNLQNTTIKNLDMVQGLNLRMLRIGGTQVKDLSPLKGMTELNGLSFGSMVTEKDLLPVLQCPLTSLEIPACLIKNLNFITNFPALTCLSIQSTPVKDLSPLRDLKLLGRFVMTDTPVRDLSPLEGLPIIYLNIIRVPATNLNVLAGIPLKYVYLGHPDVVMDLSFLAGKKLSALHLYGRVTAFAPLKEVTFDTPGINWWQLLFTSFDWVKVPDAAKLPEYLPALESLQIPSPGKAEAEIVQKFLNLKNVRVTPLPGQSSTPMTLTLDEFKKKFGNPSNQPGTK